MASIEIRQQHVSASQIARGEAGTKGERTQRPSIANGINAVARRARREYQLRFQRFRKLTSGSQIDALDVQPLAGRPPEAVMADLTQLLGWIDRRESEDGSSDTTRLARIMADEHLRRLMLSRPPQKPSPLGVRTNMPGGKARDASGAS